MLFFVNDVDLYNKCRIILEFRHWVTSTSRAVTCVATETVRGVMKPHSLFYVNNYCLHSHAHMRTTPSTTQVNILRHHISKSVWIHNCTIAWAPSGFDSMRTTRSYCNHPHVINVTIACLIWYTVLYCNYGCYRIVAVRSILPFSCAKCLYMQDYTMRILEAVERFWLCKT